MWYENDVQTLRSQFKWSELQLWFPLVTLTCKKKRENVLMFNGCNERCCMWCLLLKESPEVKIWISYSLLSNSMPDLMLMASMLSIPALPSAFWWINLVIWWRSGNIRVQFVAACFTFCFNDCFQLLEEGENTDRMCNFFFICSELSFAAMISW